MTNKIKPFYIKGLSRENQIKVITKSVTAGAYTGETLVEDPNGVLFKYTAASLFSCVGVDYNYGTYLSNAKSPYGDEAVEITLDQLEAHLRGESLTEEVSIKSPEYTPFEDLSVGDRVVVVERAVCGEVEVGVEDVLTKVTSKDVQVGTGDANWFYGGSGGKLLKLDSSPDEVSDKEETIAPAINIISEEVTTLLDSVCLCIQYTKGGYQVYGDYLEEGVVIKGVDDIKKLVEAITTITEFTKGE